MEDELERNGIDYKRAISVAESDISVRAARKLSGLCLHCGGDRMAGWKTDRMSNGRVFALCGHCHWCLPMYVIKEYRP